MNKSERARYDKLMEIAIYFGEKVLFPPLAGTYEDIRDKVLIEKERKRMVREMIENKLPKIRTRIKKDEPKPKAKKKA